MVMQGSPAWPYPVCGNDLIGLPPASIRIMGTAFGPNFTICIRIIANLRPKIEIFIRTLVRPPRGLSGVLVTRLGVSVGKCLYAKSDFALVVASVHFGMQLADWWDTWICASIWPSCSLSSRRTSQLLSFIEVSGSYITFFFFPVPSCIVY